MKLNITNSNKQICSTCIYDETVSNIKFDHEGVCNYCHEIDKLKSTYQTGLPNGERELFKIINQIKKVGRRKKYDCVIGVSGGTDSSYLLYKAHTWGLRPLAVHYDNTWNTSIATMNIHKMLKALNIDLYTHVVDNKEADDIFKSFFYAGVAEIEASTDLAYAYVLRRVASKYSIKFILEGHSFIEEGITPLGKNYFDGKYIKSIHKKYGKMKMKTYPLMTLTKFIKSIIIDRVKFIRPLWYIDYSKENARILLEKEFGWEYYGGHHLENRMTSFFHKIYAPLKFKTDFRNNTLSSQVRNGKISRSEAISIYNKKQDLDEDLIDYFIKRMNITRCEYLDIMSRDPLSWNDFPTYKRTFEILRPFFKILANLNLVPMSFYLKYCFPVNKQNI